MKNTKELDVKTSLYIKDEVHIHPNQGFELDLMNTSLGVKVFANVTIEIFNKADQDFFEGTLILNNKTKDGTIELSNKYWKKIGQPEKVRLYYENNKILIANI